VREESEREVEAGLTASLLLRKNYLQDKVCSTAVRKVNGTLSSQHLKDMKRKNGKCRVREYFWGGKKI